MALTQYLMASDYILIIDSSFQISHIHLFVQENETWFDQQVLASNFLLRPPSPTLPSVVTGGFQYISFPPHFLPRLSLVYRKGTLHPSNYYKSTHTSKKIKGHKHPKIGPLNMSLGKNKNRIYTYMMIYVA